MATAASNPGHDPFKKEKAGQEEMYHAETKTERPAEDAAPETKNVETHLAEMLQRASANLSHAAPNVRKSNLEEVKDSKEADYSLTDSVHSLLAESAQSPDP